MAALASFASELLEEAKRFLEKANETDDQHGKKAFLHAAVMVGFAAVEAHLNAIADDFLSRTDLDPHERGLLAEHTVELIDGEFQEQSTLKIWRIEDRVLFLCRRFSKKPIDRSAPYWSSFIEASRLRNGLIHPTLDPPTIDAASAIRCLNAIIELLGFMFASIYRRKLPAYSRKLSSRLTF
jgi:hypothetical protein